MNAGQSSRLVGQEIAPAFVSLAGDMLPPNIPATSTAEALCRMVVSRFQGKLLAPTCIEGMAWVDRARSPLRLAYHLLLRLRAAYATTGTPRMRNLIAARLARPE